jgi:hypothetical protein
MWGLPAAPEMLRTIVERRAGPVYDGGTLAEGRPQDGEK